MELQVQKREIFGKKVNTLRDSGLIPAELYGHGFKNLHLAVAANDFLNLFKKTGESSVIKLKISGEEKGEGGDVNVLIHDVSKDPLTDKILHIDFYQVRMGEKITTSVPIKFVGETPAVKEKNGILIRAMQEIEIEALPGNLPQNIEVDLSDLTDIGMSIYVKDIKVDKDVKVLVDGETVLATITEPTKEEVVETPITVEDVKVEGEEKKKEKEEPEKTEQHPDDPNKPKVKSH